MNKEKNIYENCPVYESENLLLRLVTIEDAEELLECYSDMEDAKLFNIDNCTSDFIYKTKVEMEDCIHYWLDEYAAGYYIRFSIIDKAKDKIAGTIEMFSKEESYGDAGVVGLLRLDLASEFETKEMIEGILQLVQNHFFKDFEVDSIITKAVPLATKRIEGLNEYGYSKVEEGKIVAYSDYYIKTVKSL